MQEGTNIKGSTKTLRHQGNLNSTPNDLPAPIAPKGTPVEILQEKEAR